MAMADAVMIRARTRAAKEHVGLAHLVTFCIGHSASYRSATSRSTRRNRRRLASTAVESWPVAPRLQSAASKAARSHSIRSPSIATTSKRHGGGAARRRRKCCAANTRRCAAWRRRAGRGAAEAARGARPHLDEDQRAVALAHDQVDLAAALRAVRARPDNCAAPAPGRRRCRCSSARASAASPSALVVGVVTVAVTTDAAAWMDRSSSRQRPPAAAGAAVSRGDALRGGHADRQPGRPDAARAARAGARRRRGLRGHRATAPRCCATSASPSR